MKRVLIALLIVAFCSLGFSFAQQPVFRTAIIGYDPPPLDAGEVISTFVSVSGATLDSTANASHDQVGNRRVQVTAHVSAFGIVTVVLSNQTGSPLDLLSGNLRVTVFDYNAPPPPSGITVTPTSPVFQAEAGTLPPAQILTITTSTGENWIAHDTSPWFGTTSESGSYPSSGPSGSTLRIEVHNDAQLGPGTHVDTIRCVSPGLPDKLVTVTLIITGGVSGTMQDALIATIPNATAMFIASDGRIFVAQQTGQLRVVQNGQLLATPFLTVTTDSTNERGLLGVTLDPNFSSNQYVYVYYTVPSPAHNRLSRFVANGNVATAGETILLDLDSSADGETSHNGGAIHFGLDGKLYIAVGDNGNGNNSQSLSTLKGKLLRLNGDGSIPTDNPFYNTVSGNNRAIWATGLRNPFTFSVQRTTGRIFINDVGANAWEEINEGQGGANYGWPSEEGPSGNPNLVSPFYSYSHTDGCAITGGAFYDPVTANFPPQFVGDYFFADFCSGWIRALDVSTLSVVTVTNNAGRPVDIQVADDGSLYYLQHATGGMGLRRIRFN